MTVMKAHGPMHFCMDLYSMVNYYTLVTKFGFLLVKTGHVPRQKKPILPGNISFADCNLLEK